jgi:hypothetical protein
VGAADRARPGGRPIAAIPSQGAGRRAGSLAGDWRAVLAVVMAVAAAYTWWHLDRGWFPVDDGALAHSAERLLQGELPHRDFDDVYTGGLAWVNAGAFRLFGTSFWSARVALFALFVGWIPAVFLVARRFSTPLVAGGVTLLAAAWALPSYAAPMPSWYNLFLATFGVAALVRFLEERTRRWLVAAGIAGGLSLLVKVIGLYYVAGVLLFLVAQAHADAHDEAGDDAMPRDARAAAYATFTSAALLLFVAALLYLVRRQAHAPELVHFVVPAALIAALLAHDEWRRPAGPSAARVRALARLVVPFLAGVALPVAVFVIPYLRSDALGALVNGVFVLPARRFDSASVPMLSLATLLTLLLPAAVVAPGLRARGWMDRPRAVHPLLLATGLLLLGTGWSTLLYRLVWNSARMLLPALVVAGVLAVARDRRTDAAARLDRSRTLLLLCVTALCGLVQFPFSVAIYFCYVAPLVILLALSLYRYLPAHSGWVPLALVTLYLGFAVARVDGGAQMGMGRFYLRASSVPMAPLPGTRGGIRAPAVVVREYETITALLGAHARGGYTWASPDSPEIYVLSGLRNPTRSLYEFFDDTTGYTARTLATLDAHGVTAIVQNRRPPFSRPISPELSAALASRYPSSAEAGPYLVRWR